MKEKILYQQKYKNTAFLKHGKLPDLRHLTNGFYVHEARILSAGQLEIDGEKMEFNDIRVYIKESSDEKQNT